MASAKQTTSSSEAGPYSFESFVSFINKNFSVILLIGVTFIVGFFGGSLWTENQMLKGNGGAVKAAAADQDKPSAPTQPNAPQGPTEDQLSQVPEVTNKDHIRGNKNAKVVLIEYSDYECPFCNRYHPTMKQVIEEYGNDVAWVYRHYPLPFHPSAQPAAEASECVAKLGGNDAFWTYSDTLYEAAAKGSLAQSDIDDAVVAAGVSQAAVQDCVDSGEFTQMVKDQMTAGSKAGVSGTPGTVVKTKDGQYDYIGGALPFEQVKATIDKFL